MPCLHRRTHSSLCAGSSGARRSPAHPSRNRALQRLTGLVASVWARAAGRAPRCTLRRKPGALQSRPAHDSVQVSLSAGRTGPPCCKVQCKLGSALSWRGTLASQQVYSGCSWLTSCTCIMSGLGHSMAAMSSRVMPAKLVCISFSLLIDICCVRPSVSCPINWVLTSGHC